jgi:hypothetical protein
MALALVIFAARRGSQKPFRSAADVSLGCIVLCGMFYAEGASDTRTKIGAKRAR